jgi:hypothetical protein
MLRKQQMRWEKRMQAKVKQSVAHTVIVRYWSISLGLGMAVIGAVALLLGILDRTAANIQAGAAEIWVVGKLIANNTVHIPLTRRINGYVAEILAAADHTAGATERVQRAVGSDSTTGEHPV